MTSKLVSRQTLKVAIYSLLLINFALYVIDDIRVASYTMRNGGSLLEWTRSFATTIDESAWFVLLFLFELETYLLSKQTLNRPIINGLIQGARIFCYAFLMHSVYAFSVIYIDLLQVNEVPNIINLCEMVPMDLAFVRNLAYTVLDAENCLTLSSAETFYFTEPGLVVSDFSGLSLERNLALVDILEVLVWLIILMTIESMVWLQERSITQGKLVSFITGAKYILYISLWLMAAFWAYLGHYYFAWDEALWIIGFISIEMNVSERKREIEREVITGT